MFSVGKIGARPEKVLVLFENDISTIVDNLSYFFLTGYWVTGGRVGVVYGFRSEQTGKKILSESRRESCGEMIDK